MECEVYVMGTQDRSRAEPEAGEDLSMRSGVRSIRGNLVVGRVSKCGQVRAYICMLVRYIQHVMVDVMKRC